MNGVPHLFEEHYALETNDSDTHLPLHEGNIKSNTKHTKGQLDSGLLVNDCGNIENPNF